MIRPCSHEPVQVTVTLAGGEVVLNRCAVCDLTWWTEAGRPARRRAVYAAVGRDAPRLLRRRRVGARLAPRGSPPDRPSPMGRP